MVIFVINQSIKTMELSMTSIRETAVKITKAVNEQTNVYDAVDVVTEMLDPNKEIRIRQYKKNFYEIVSEGKMKNPDNGNWLKCIHYKSLKDGKLYTREKKDFEKKFTSNETKA